MAIFELLSKVLPMIGKAALFLSGFIFRKKLDEAGDAHKVEQGVKNMSDAPMTRSELIHALRKDEV